MSQSVPKRIGPPLAVYLLLFAVTFASCVVAGTIWALKDATQVENWHYGVQYAVLILTFLTAHEFGHYFAARFHGVKTSLPYYLPFPFIAELSFGTFGAVIRLRSQINSRKVLFDIGAAGPISGFVVCLVFMIYGLNILPDLAGTGLSHSEHLYSFARQSIFYNLYFGDNLFFELARYLFDSGSRQVPAMNKVYFYPYLNVAWFGLFVTSLNMLPMGQLDGGHIIYAMFGKWVHRLIGKIVWWALLALGLLSLINIFYQLVGEYRDTFFFSYFWENYQSELWHLTHDYAIIGEAWAGWLLWAAMTRFFMKLGHPVAFQDEPLGTARMLIGWLAIGIFVLSFTWNGIYYF